MSSDESIESVELSSMDLGTGRADLRLKLDDELFYRMLSEKIGFEIGGDRELMKSVCELAEIGRAHV